MRRQFKKPVADMNVVPYIDVMLVLLVIFMITAPVLFHGVEVNLPIAQSAPMPNGAQEPIILSIDAKGRYYLNVANDPKRALSKVELTKLLLLHRESLQEPGVRQLLIKGDRTLSYQVLAKTLVLLQDLGIGNTGLITELDD